MILPNSTSKLTLTNTLHIPTLGTDLISLGVLHRKGTLVRSWEKGLMISKDGEDLFTAVLGGSTGTLYQVQCVNASNGSAFVAEATSSMHLWHRQMGHLSPRVIDLMLRNQAVNGLKIGNPKDFDHLCNGCANGKSHRLPMPGTSTSQYFKMELLMIDLTGPMSVSTWDGFLYALVVIEVSCHYAVGRLLHDRDETGPTVRNIVAMLERQSGLKAHRLRSDNGTKFINTTMSQFCQQNGIIHETTVPYLLEQNGIAECAIAVFFEMVCCMLWSAGVDLRYWGEAFMYAVYIRSLTLTSGLKEIVPYEAWTGRKPDVSHLRIFGSLGWAHIPKQVRKGKLESRVVKVWLLGWWTNKTKGYQLEDMENGKLITSQDIQFFEDSSPNDAINREANQRDTHQDSESSYNISEIPTVPSTNHSTTPTNDEPNHIPAASPSAPKKSLKWNNLPKRDASNCTQKPPERYALLSTDNAIAINDSLNLGFVAVANEPQSFQEAAYCCNVVS